MDSQKTAPERALSAAVTDLAPSLGLPELPISVAPEWANHRAVVPWWKQAAAERVVAAGRLLVWTDDDIGMFRTALGAFERRADVLLIAPDPEHGLSQHDLEEISRFLGL